TSIATRVRLPPRTSSSSRNSPISPQWRTARCSRSHAGRRSRGRIFDRGTRGPPGSDGLMAHRAQADEARPEASAAAFEVTALPFPNCHDPPHLCLLAWLVAGANYLV